MAFQNITNLQLGNLLQIVFSNGIRNQISQDFRDFEMIKRAKESNSVARELRFMFQNSLGAAAIQYSNPGVSGRSFPAAQQVRLSEFSAKYKEMNATIELEYNIYDRARKSPEKYGEPLAIEIASKTSASKRRLAADLYGDGTGVMGTVASTALTSTPSNQLKFQLSTLNVARGHVGFFEPDDLLVLKSVTGGTSALTTNLATQPAVWQVVERIPETQQVTLLGLSAALVPVATMTVVTLQPTAGDVFYRIGQGTIPDLTSNATVGDYGVTSEVIAGLDSLTANDSRLIHGITMSGSNAGTHFDAAGNPLDVQHIQKVMSKVKTIVGQDRYNWKMMIMNPSSYDSLVESRETDRRFNTIDDVTRGAKKIVYQHQNDSLECYTSEFCQPKRIYILPEAKAGEKVIEFHGTDFESVKGEDMSSFRLKAGASGYVNTMQSFLSAMGVIICKHPASIAVIENFTNS